MVRLILGFCLALTLIGCDSGPRGVKAGDQFPAFVMRDVAGKTLSSEALRGKVIVFNVWATWCGPCRAELPSLQALAGKLDPQRFQVIGLALESDTHLVTEFLSERNISFPNYVDAGEAIYKHKLKMTAVPATFIIDRNGRVVEVVMGARAWDSEKMVKRIEGHWHA